MFRHRSVAVSAVVLAVGSLLLVSAPSYAATAWSLQSTASQAGGAVFNGVSCPSTTSCTAVGYYVPSNGDATLAESWDGTAWAVQTTPNPTGALGSRLSAVSCVTTTACTAVGSYQQSATQAAALAESWNGATWVVGSAQNPGGSTAENYVFNAVSCWSAAGCMAVGEWNPPAGETLLVERWNGSQWSFVNVSPPSGLGSTLNGISCLSGKECTAVGTKIGSSGTQVPLVEHWNGTSWVQQSTPRVTNNATLDSVSCSSASACTAAGTGGAGGSALMERWNGTLWNTQVTANPRGESITSVSCSSDTNCTAVGSYDPTISPFTLAEHWNGTYWSIQATPNPSGAPLAYLEGVSCVYRGICTAVGGQDFAARHL
jgi:hypothetical protein